MITNNEPGIYLENKYGIRIENELLCVEKATNEFGEFLCFETITYAPIDLDARKKGNSYYPAGTVIPMLPRKLANWICSLRPKEERCAMSIRMEIDKDGNVVRKELFPSIIKSDIKMDYQVLPFQILLLLLHILSLSLLEPYLFSLFAFIEINIIL